MWEKGASPRYKKTHTHTHRRVWPVSLSTHQKVPLSFDNPCPASSTGGCLPNKSCPWQELWGGGREQNNAFSPLLHTGTSNEIPISPAFPQHLTEVFLHFLFLTLSSDISFPYCCGFTDLWKHDTQSCSLGTSYSKNKQIVQTAKDQWNNVPILEVMMNALTVPCR